MTFSICRAECCKNGLQYNTPALLIRMEMSPTSDLTALANSSTCSRSATSQVKAKATPWFCCTNRTVSSLVSVRMSTQITMAPFLAKSKAKARPIPWPAPVTNATSPEMLLSWAGKKKRNPRRKNSNKALRKKKKIHSFLSCYWGYYILGIVKILTWTKTRPSREKQRQNGKWLLQYAADYCSVIEIESNVNH